MALIKCKECGSMISDKAQACPKCGCPASAIHKESVQLPVCPQCGYIFPDGIPHNCPICKLPSSQIIRANEKVIDNHVNDVTDAEQLLKQAYNYEHGIGVGVNFSLAFSLYLKSAEKGNVDAMENVARLYAGWKSEDEKAREWALKAQKNGSERVYSLVGEELTRRNYYFKALKWHNLAKENNENGAQDGYMYCRKKIINKSLPYIIGILCAIIIIPLSLSLFNTSDNYSLDSLESKNPQYWEGKWTISKIQRPNGEWESFKDDKSFTFDASTMKVHIVTLGGIEMDREWAVIPDGSGVAFKMGVTHDANRYVQIIDKDGHWYSRNIDTQELEDCGMILERQQAK